jgi:hypothetical protein
MTSAHRCQCPELGHECPACVAYRLGPKESVSHDAVTRRSTYLGNIGVLLGTRRQTMKSQAQRQAELLAAVGRWVQQTGRLPGTADLQQRAREVGLSMNLVYKAYGSLDALYEACLAQGVCTARHIAAARLVQRRANQANGAKAHRRSGWHGQERIARPRRSARHA